MRVRRATAAVVALTVIGAAPVVTTPARDGRTGTALASGPMPPPPTATWLETINFYRTSSGLSPIVEEPSWSAGASKHVDYLLNTPASQRTGAYASAHTENPASVWYTQEGEAAAAASNIGPGTTEREAVDGWMRAPFHALGVLRPRLERSGFAMRGGTAVLDVLRGLGSTASSSPVLFPGPDSFTYLTSVTAERPDPRAGCAVDVEQFQGLPLFAMFPEAPPAGTTATLTLPDGRTIAPGGDLCVHTAGTYSSSDPVYGSAGAQILAADNAVLVIPRVRLTGGVHTATIIRPGFPDVTWSFTVLAPPSVPTEVRALWAGTGKVHLSWSAPASSGSSALTGFLAGTATLPTARTLDPAGRAVVLDVPAGPSGSVSVAASNAYATGPFAFDSWSRPSLPGQAGLGNLMAVPSTPPAGTAAVLANLAMVDALAPGYVTANRCSQLRDQPQVQASGSHGVREAIANLAVVPVDADGTFCLFNQVPTHLIVDVQGSFATDGALAFDPIPPTRLLDTRTIGPIPPSGAIVRVETGAAAGTTAALVNLAMTDATLPGYITADRCSALTTGPQTKASGNHGITTAIANLAVVPLDPDGSFCIYTQVPTHLVVDLQGTFAPDGTLRFSPADDGAPTRVLDTRTLGPIPTSDSIVRVETGAAAGTTAALVNLAMTDATLPGYITADRCSALTTGPQTKASGNHGITTAIANLAVVPLDPDGSFCIYTQVPTHLVVDLQGTFAPDGTLRFSPADDGAPTRVLDTRL